MDVTPLRDLARLPAAVLRRDGLLPRRRWSSYVAIPFQIYTLTGSNFAVGAIGLVELVPLVVFGLYGGALADHVDRRRLLDLDRASPRRRSPPCSPSTRSATTRASG